MRFTRLAAVAFAISVASDWLLPPRRSDEHRRCGGSTARSPDNVKLDAGRASRRRCLQFLGLKPGMNVLDLFGANAYWAEIMAPVVGPKGHVTVWMPTQFTADKRKQSFATFMARAPECVDRLVAVRSSRPAEELCGLRDPQRQLSRHLLGERQAQASRGWTPMRC